MNGHHNPRCRDYNPACPCLTCSHDNYRQRTFVQCCNHQKKACNTATCKHYVQDAPRGRQDAAGDATEQLKISYTADAIARHLRK